MLRRRRTLALARPGVRPVAPQFVALGGLLFVLGGAPGCGSSGSSSEEPLPILDEPAPAPQGDGALAFDGASHYATVGSAGFPFGLAPHSIALWVKPQRLDGVQNFVVLRKDFQSGVQLGLRDGVPTAWRVFGARTYAAAAEPIEADAWRHVAYVFDGAVHHLYVDGVEQGTGDLEPNNRTATTGWLGSLDGRSELFEGSMDRVRVWSEARSAEQIAADAAGSDPRSEALVLDLSFDETDPLRAYDRSGHGNHATLGDGFAAWAPRRVPSDLGLN